ncbi:CPBP family intramembrane glutamic endopeptidase [Streptococcus danieliae]|uniref:CPBP family intramembrane metalloprotease n=1 Tax=Streptococcus danieliae TaxID=747656 RepID=A0A7Z0M511_9STRE|nr:CPBP family intramembrane glutamic endopeptidase [Streptococcus danieliae]MBF0698777.1 CPBP family intramembrane metalloprotease [Streptococcus danieliae]NYS95954.1 CPBP family intramembrane metalloprotease [Streptococcus danieliae]
MTRQQIQVIWLSISLIIIASIIYSLGLATLFFSPSNELQLFYQVSLLFFMPLGFVVVPCWISNKNDLCNSQVLVQFNWKSFVILAFIIYMVNGLFLHSEEYFPQMVIAICEEYLFRSLIYRILRTHFAPLWAILIGSFLFGLLLHMNYPLLDNVFVRFPLGLLFSGLTLRFGLQYAIAGHWIFNLIQSIL